MEKDWPRYHLRRISLSSRSKRKTAPRQPPTLRREGKKVKEEYIGKCDQYGNTDFTQQEAHHQSENASWQEDFNHWQQKEQQRRLQRSPYEILGVPHTATTAEIKQAYRNLVKQYHPDHNPHLDHKIMAEINVAYDTLMK